MSTEAVEQTESQHEPAGKEPSLTLWNTVNCLEMDQLPLN